jgi:hypothetical protein
MSEQIIIQHLMSGINPDFRKELSRRASSMNTLPEFLKYAKIEQDLCDTFEKSCNSSRTPQQPYFDNNSSTPSFTAMIDKPPQRYSYTAQDNRRLYHTPTQSSVYQRNAIPQSGNRSMIIPHKQFPDNSPPVWFQKKQVDHQSTFQNKFQNCKICGRTNHRTIDCFYKRTTGCFKCGQQNHTVRDCTIPPNFQ